MHSHPKASPIELTCRARWRHPHVISRLIICGLGGEFPGYFPPYWSEQRVSQGLEGRQACLWWGWRWGLENLESAMYLIQYVISGSIGGHSLRQLTLDEALRAGAIIRGI